MKSYIVHAIAGYDEWKTTPPHEYDDEPPVPDDDYTHDPTGDDVPVAPPPRVGPESYDEMCDREDAAIWRADAEREEEA